MRKLMKNDQADVRMIGAAVGIFVTLIIAALVFFNIAGSIDVSTIDSKWVDGNTTDADNATTNILTQTETFFQIAPIIGIVIVAVVILAYVGRIGGAA